MMNVDAITAAGNRSGIPSPEFGVTIMTESKTTDAEMIAWLTHEAENTMLMRGGRRYLKGKLREFEN